MRAPVANGSAGRSHRYQAARPARVVYRDRPDLVRHAYRYDYAYRDYHGLLRSRLVWPRYRFAIHYGHGPWYTWRYFYPYYHRKYIFISLGGYWPIGCSYLRYHWYGCHPYYWYGYYPVAREVQTPTYNYYTYNYYDEESTQAADPAPLEDVQDQGPDQVTLADVYFEEAVKAFEVGSYRTAAMKFARAMELAPNDQILPFAYSQSLMAAEQYPEAAQVLREALAKVRPEAEGVFYPRGLYTDEDALLEQIDRLAEKSEKYSYESDLQLLLGYQLLGIGEVDRAVDPLLHAREDLVNARAAGVLLNLAEKIKTSDVKPEGSQPSPPPAQSKTNIQGHPLELEETLLAGDTVIAEDISEEPQHDLTLAQNQPAPTEHAIRPDEMIYAEDIKVIEEPGGFQSSPVLAQSEATLRKHPMKLQGTMFLASLCALATSAGIRGYIRG